MRLYLTVRPEDVREAAPYRRELAHAAYHIGEESALLRRNLLVQTSGGLLVLSDRGAPPVEDPEGLAGALLRECGRRSYSGIVLDFEMPPRRDLSDLAAALGRSCAAGHRPLYLPEAYAKLTAQRSALPAGTARGCQLTLWRTASSSSTRQCPAAALRSTCVKSSHFTAVPNTLRWTFNCSECAFPSQPPPGWENR